ncbi:hypothetical protein T265_15419, partial [Opisthorchis viverrini]
MNFSDVPGEIDKIMSVLACLLQGPLIAHASPQKSSTTEMLINHAHQNGSSSKKRTSILQMPRCVYMDEFSLRFIANDCLSAGRSVEQL